MRYAQLVGVQRVQLLASLNRRDFDRPFAIRTNYAAWDDTVLTFSAETNICDAEIVVNDDVDLVILTSRLQAFLEYARGPSSSRITYTTSIEQYGSVAKARHVLCDEIVSRTFATTIGRMKPLASGLKAGMITVTIEEYRNSITFEFGNSSRGRLFGAWTAVCLRLAQLKQSREPNPQDRRQGFIIFQDVGTGLYLVIKESHTFGGRPTLLLYAEDHQCRGVFFNEAGDYPQEDAEVSLSDAIPPVRAIITAQKIELPDS